jgi:hypothetical protein
MTNRSWIRPVKPGKVKPLVGGRSIRLTGMGALTVNRCALATRFESAVTVGPDHHRKSPLIATTCP